MKISQIIEKLDKLKGQFGDMDVTVWNCSRETVQPLDVLGATEILSGYDKERCRPTAVIRIDTLTPTNTQA